MRELSLKPYSGRCFIAKSRKDYERAHARIFATPDVLTCAQQGRMSGGEGKDGIWTYLIWGESAPQVAHELSHVILHVFERCGIDPRGCNGEPFCYMLSQMMIEAQPKPAKRK